MGFVSHPDFTAKVRFCLPLFGEGIVRGVTYRSARFVVDGIEEEFAGFTAGDFWNGWACPVFTRQVAEQVLAASETNGYRWQYNPASNAFEVRHEDDPEDYEPQIFNGVTVTFEDGHSIDVYAIGAYSWTWTEAEQVL